MSFKIHIATEGGTICIFTEPNSGGKAFYEQFTYHDKYDSFKLEKELFKRLSVYIGAKLDPELKAKLHYAVYQVIQEQINLGKLSTNEPLER